jgi:chorismate synthase
MLSIPATKGFEFGSGFDGTRIPGSVHNDPFVQKEDGTLGTTSNFSGKNIKQPCLIIKVACKAE